jgi:hypothetical protein
VKAWRKELKEVKHQITNHKIILKLYPATRDLKSRVKIAGADSKKSVRASTPKAKGLPSGFKWVDRKGLSKLPFSSAQDKLRSFVSESASMDLYAKKMARG